MSEETEPRPPLAPLVVDEVNKAYYSALLAAPDRARTRALNASTIAAAAAAAVVAAGYAGGFERLPGWAAVLGFATVLLWLSATGAYLSAVAGPARAKPPVEAVDPNDTEQPGSAANPDEHELAAARSAKRKITATEARLKLVQRRAETAHHLTIAALLGTAMILGLSAFGPTRDRREAANVVLSADGARELTRACGGNRDSVRARVEPAALTNDFVRLALDPRICAGRDDVRLRSELIVAVAFEG